MKPLSKSIYRLWMICAVVFGLCGAAQAWITENFESYAKPDGAIIPNGVALGAFKYYASNGKGAYFDASGLFSSKGLFRNWDADHGGFNSTDFSFTREDRSRFNLQSILLWDASGESPRVVLRGFRNREEVKKFEVNPYNLGSSTTYGLNWTDIDSVAISDSTDESGNGADLCAFIDNIVWEPFVLPTITMARDSGLGATAATLKATVNANNTSATVSVQYGTTASYGNAQVTSPSGIAGSIATPVSASLAALASNTTYHYRFKSTNSSGDAYSGDATFTTLASLPSAITDPATGVGSSTATLNGSVNAFNANTAVTFQYGATSSYGNTVAAPQSPLAGSSVAAVSVALTGLIPNTTYHFRVVGVNSAGTTNGGDRTFTTSGAAPAVLTGTKSGISSTGVTLHGTVNANNATTTDSIQFGTSNSPYSYIIVAGPATSSGSSATSISATIPGLQPNTTYHYRVKAVNATGTSYGDDSTFTTSAILPDAATGSASGVAAMGASVAGLVKANNAITTDSVQYGPTTGYGTTVVASPATSTGTGTTSIAATLNGLAPNTTYHYRVKAVNLAGASYGSDASFTTSAIVPSVSTGSASDVGSVSATVSGSVNANNSTTTDSVQYGPTTSYGSTVVAAPATSSGSSVASIAATLNGLAPNTTYHYRVKAVNAAGTSYGPDSTFTTTLLPQSISFGALAAQVYGAEYVKLTASASSGLSVAYASANEAAVHISNDTAYLLAADTATITATQAGNSDYLAANPVSRILTVAKKPLNIAGAMAEGKEYDGTTDATVTQAHLDGVVNSDDVTLNLGTASFSTKDTGTAKAVTVTGSTLSGTKSGNYSLTEASGLTASIGTKELSINIDAKVKEYGEADPALTYMATPLCSGDSFTGSLARASGEDVGDHAISLGTLSAGGNYRINLTGANLTITKKTLTIAGATAQGKEYDGTTDATVTQARLDGVVNSDDVTLNLGTASFATKDTGTAKAVTVTGSTLSGTKSGNYSLTEVSGLTASIGTKDLAINIDAKDKVYGEADPALTYMATPLCSGDSFTGSLSRASGEDVGDHTIGLGTLSAGGNYRILLTGAKLTITKKPLTIAGATARGRDYDGTTDATVTGAFLDGVVNADDVSLVLGTATFATKDTGTAKAVTVAGSTLSGAKAGNYSLTEVSGLTANIAPKSVTVNIDAKSKVQGETDPALTYMATPLVGSDSWSGALTRDPGEDPGDYKIHRGTLTAGSNYDIYFVDADLTISRVSALGARPRRSTVSLDVDANVRHVFASMAPGSGAGALGEGACREDKSCQSIEVALPAPARVMVAIFDNMGTPVISLRQDVDAAAFRRLQPTLDGRRSLSLSWNLRSSSGVAVQPGVFLWKLEVVTEDGRKLETVKRIGVK